MPYPLLALHENVHVFDRPRTAFLQANGLRVAFAGFPYARDVRAGFPALIEETRHGQWSADLRVLCVHQCIEGATCGPGDFTFRGGEDVVRSADLPPGFAAVLSGHIHRHQVLRAPGAPPVVYAGSVERTSFAEADETKGAVLVELDRGGVRSIDFRPLPARPMVVKHLSFAGLDAARAGERIEAAVAGTPPDAVVQLRIEGPLPAGAEGWLAAESLRAIAGERNVTVARPGGRLEGPIRSAVPREEPAPPSAQGTFGW
jgi:DNA repair exonuclease SbcCD nuclease subunit